MADTKTSALVAASLLGDSDYLMLVSGGVSTRVTLTQLTAYFEQRARQTNAAVAQQTFGASEAYVLGSDVPIPTGRLQAKTMYRTRMQLTKTSTTSSTGTPIVNVKVGTNGTTADTTRAALTFGAQTAVADSGFLEVFVTWRAVGSSAVLQAVGMIDHQLASTGLAQTNVAMARTTSSAFDASAAGLRIGITFNGGTSFAGNTDLVQAELLNLA